MNAEHPARLFALPATMLLFVAIAPSARADRAENAFVVVEGDGVVRLDGKNFAVLSSGKGESLVKVTAQPGWKLDTPSEERSHSESGKGIETIELGPDAYCGNEFSADTSNDWANPGTNSIQP